MPRTSPTPFRLQPPDAEIDVTFPGASAPYRFRFHGREGVVLVAKDPVAPSTYSIIEGRCSCPGGENHGYCKHLDFARTVWDTWTDVCAWYQAEVKGTDVVPRVSLVPGWQDAFKREREEVQRVAAADPAPEPPGPGLVAPRCPHCGQVLP